jgi:hypothetical protein
MIISDRLAQRTVRRFPLGYNTPAGEVSWVINYRSRRCDIDLTAPWQALVAQGFNVICTIARFGRFGIARRNGACMVRRGLLSWPEEAADLLVADPVDFYLSTCQKHRRSLPTFPSH